MYINIFIVKLRRKINTLILNINFVLDATAGLCPNILDSNSLLIGMSKI